MPVLTDKERAGVDVLVAVLGLPLWILLGFRSGLWIEDIGPDETVHAILLRALLCAGPAFLALLLARKLWLLPAASYFCAFAAGYGFGKALGHGTLAAVEVVLRLSSFGLHAAEPSPPPEASGREGAFVLGFAVWITLFVASVIASRRSPQSPSSSSH